MLTQEQLKEYLHYDEISGVFTWIKKAAKGAIIGTHPGTINSSGYVQLQLMGKLYLLHRLAWFYVYGYWPRRLDHKDRDKTHNWISNLREASQSQNVFHTKRKPPNTGVRGVHLAHDGKYRATIYHQTKKINLGRYDSLEKAEAAYKQKALELFPGFIA